MLSLQNLLAQIKAPLQALNLPKSHILRVSHVQEFPRETTDEFYDYSVVRGIQEMPHRLIIDGFDELNQKFHLGINLETEKIEFANWPVLLGQEFNSKTNLVKFWPSLLLTFPIWGSLNYILRNSKTITGLEINKLLLFLKLENQIESKYVSILKRALSS